MNVDRGHDVVDRQTKLIAHVAEVDHSNSVVDHDKVGFEVCVFYRKVITHFAMDVHCRVLDLISEFPLSDLPSSFEFLSWGLFDLAE